MRGLGSGHVNCGEDLSNERRCLLHRGRTDKHTKNRDFRTESAQWADSVKKVLLDYIFKYFYGSRYLKLTHFLFAPIWWLNTWFGRVDNTN